MNEQDMLYLQASIIENHEKLRRELWVYVFEAYLQRGIPTAGNMATEAVDLFDRTCPPVKATTNVN